MGDDTYTAFINASNQAGEWRRKADAFEKELKETKILLENEKLASETRETEFNAAMNVLKDKMAEELKTCDSKSAEIEKEMALLASELERHKSAIATAKQLFTGINDKITKCENDIVKIRTQVENYRPPVELPTLQNSINSVSSLVDNLQARVEAVNQKADLIRLSKGSTSQVVIPAQQFAYTLPTNGVNDNTSLAVDKDADLI